MAERRTRAVYVLVVLSFLLAVGNASGNERDPLGYERLLIPIWTNQKMPGAYGSLWETELVVRNDSEAPVQVFQSVCAFFCECRIIIECAPLPSIAPHTNARYLVANEDSPSNVGVFLYVQRRYLSDVAANVRLRDTSRSTQTAGTEVPVIREDRFFTRRARVLNIPLDSNSRARLRIYGVGSPSGGGDVRIRVYPLDGNEAIAERVLAITPPRLSEGRLPLPSEEVAQPGFVEIPSIRDLITTPQVPDAVRVDIEPVTVGLVFWALVTVTNNETQQVTIISPQ